MTRVRTVCLSFSFFPSSSSSVSTFVFFVPFVVKAVSSYSDVFSATASRSGWALAMLRLRT